MEELKNRVGTCTAKVAWARPTLTSQIVAESWSLVENRNGASLMAAHTFLPIYHPLHKAQSGRTHCCRSRTQSTLVHFRNIRTTDFRVWAHQTAPCKPDLDKRQQSCYHASAKKVTHAVGGGRDAQGPGQPHKVPKQLARILASSPNRHGLTHRHFPSEIKSCNSISQ